MKLFIRFGCIVLSIVLLFGCVFSVSAADEYYSINILDYGFLDGGDTHFKTFNNGVGSFYYDIPFTYKYYSSEMLVRFSSTSDVLESFSIVDETGRSYTVSSYYLGDSYYRLLFSFRGYSLRRVICNFEVNLTSSANIQILSFKISPINATIYEPDFNAYITWNTHGDNSLDRSFLAVNSFGPESISCTSYRVDFDFTDEWRKYDHIDLCLSLQGCTIDSVNVMMSNDVSVPFEVNEIIGTTSDSDNTTYTFMVSIDLTTIYRSGDLYVLVRGSGGLTNDSIKTQWISCNSCTAYIRADSFSNPLFFWLNRIWLALKPSGSETAADDFKDKVDEQATELEGIKDSLDSVEKPNAADINLNIDAIVAPSDLNLATSGLSSVMGNDIFINVLLLVLTFATVGFILYGKR